MYCFDFAPDLVCLPAVSPWMRQSWLKGQRRQEDSEQHDTEHSAMKLMRMFQELPEHGTSCFPRLHFKQHIKLNKPCGAGSEFP